MSLNATPLNAVEVNGPAPDPIVVATAPGELLLAGFAPVVRIGTSVQCGTGTLVLVGYAPTVTATATRRRIGGQKTPRTSKAASRLAAWEAQQEANAVAEQKRLAALKPRRRVVTVASDDRAFVVDAAAPDFSSTGFDPDAEDMEDLLAVLALID